MTERLYGPNTELLSERPIGSVHAVLGSVTLSGSKETGSGANCPHLPSFRRHVSWPFPFCPCHVDGLPVSCQRLACVMLVACRCHVSGLPVMLMACLCHVSGLPVMLMACLCHVGGLPVMLMACLCHVGGLPVSCRWRGCVTRTLNLGMKGCGFEPQSRQSFVPSCI